MVCRVLLVASLGWIGVWNGINGLCKSMFMNLFVWCFCDFAFDFVYCLFGNGTCWFALLGLFGT